MNRHQFSALIAVTLSVGFGCNQLLGIEEKEYNSTLDHGANTGGLGGTGGASTGGMSAMTGGAPNTCDAGFGDPNSPLLRSCLLRVSCHPLIPRFTISDCLSFDSPGFTPSDECTRGAQDCSDIAACTGMGYAESDECDDVTEPWFCDDRYGVRCDVDEPYEVNCAALGAVCAPYEDPEASAYFPCQLPALSVDCNGRSPGDFRCADDYLYHCIDDIPYGQDCQETGGTCVDGEAGAYCSELPTCNSPGEVTCEGDAVVVCDVDGFRGRYDCAPSGGSCELEGDSGYCVAPGCSTESDCEEECLADGTTMELCVGGALMVVNCEDFGFSECVEWASVSDPDVEWVGCR